MALHPSRDQSLQDPRGGSPETFKISPDPLLTGKIGDVVGLYLTLPVNAAAAPRRFPARTWLPSALATSARANRQFAVMSGSAMRWN
jgi:hypothetical protein